MKITFIEFQTRMMGFKKKNMAIFDGNVRVLHLPGDDPRMNINMDKVIGEKLPPGGMFIRSQKLRVLTRPNPAGGKEWQEMHASGRAFVASPEFSGQAESISYDEEKDQVIFDGGKNGTATLWKQERQGEAVQKVIGQKIYYSRKTGNHQIEKASDIQGH
jgi:hypothetical protein